MRAHPSARRVGAVLTTLLAGAAVLTAPGVANAITFTPGAPGAGDPYFPYMGNGGYLVSHYDIALQFTPSSGAINATTTIMARSTQDLSRFDLDFTGPQITALTVDGQSALYSRVAPQELVITPSAGIPEGTRFTVVVRYAGVPHQVNNPSLGASGWLATKDGAVALNQPFGAATYYPVNDTPQNKATYTQHVTVPTGLTVLANGEGGPTITRGGETTWVYSMQQPMASELSSIAIGRYNLTSGTADGGNRKVLDLTALGTSIDTKPGQGVVFNHVTAAVIAFESSIYGPYPFSSVGGLIDKLSVQYSLEVQGRPVYPGSSTTVYPSLLAHELGHQWFGDSVTPEHWSDVWLNEGFATYSQWLWAAHKGESLRQIVRQQYGFAQWAGVVADPGARHLFGDLVYVRGALTLQALRDAVGDAAFFKILRGWVAVHRYGNASTTDFINFAEGSSGKNLTQLFQNWLYTPGRQPMP